MLGRQFYHHYKWPWPTNNHCVCVFFFLFLLFYIYFYLIVCAATPDSLLCCLSGKSKMKIPTESSDWSCTRIHSYPYIKMKCDNAYFKIRPHAHAEWSEKIWKPNLKIFIYEWNGMNRDDTMKMLFFFNQKRHSLRSQWFVRWGVHFARRMSTLFDDISIMMYTHINVGDKIFAYIHSSTTWWSKNKFVSHILRSSSIFFFLFILLLSLWLGPRHFFSLDFLFSILFFTVRFLF